MAKPRRLAFLRGSVWVLVILACTDPIGELAACPETPADTVGWRVVDEGPFVLRLPREFEKGKVDNFDSYLGEWVAPGRRLFFDVGPYSGVRGFERTLAAPEVSVGALDAISLCRMEVGDRRILVVHKRSGGDSLTWVAGWRGHDGEDTDLLVSVTTPDSGYGPAAFAILRSVRVKED